MYKFSDKQISFSDFKQPVGMKMSAENRWVKKAELIPWSEIELEYARLFLNRNGNVAKPFTGRSYLGIALSILCLLVYATLRLALGACIIQAEYGFSDAEVALQIQEGPYLQFFCGFAEYKDEAPFDSSLMVCFRKRLTPEILGEINEMIIQKAQERKKKVSEDSDGDDTNGGENSGTLIVDATCAPSEIRYPTDTSLLDEARENSEAIIDLLHDSSIGKKPRTYRCRAHKEYNQFVRSRKPGQKKIRKCIRKQLGYLGRNLATIDKMLEAGGSLSSRWQKRLETLRIVHGQQAQMYQSKTHSVPNRIVSISQPHLRPIVRGKAKSPVEFGAKLDISVVDGYTRLETLSFEPYNEATFLQDVIQRYKMRTGHYPQRVLADKIYRNRENLRFCKEHGIRLSGPALGRPKKDVKPDKQQDYADICDRVEVERKISLAKRKCGLGLLTTRLEETTASAIALSIVVLNLRKIWHLLFRSLCFFLLRFLQNVRNRRMAFVQ